MKKIRSIIDREQPDLLLGNSCGSFLAQMLAPVVGIPTEQVAKATQLPLDMVQNLSY